MKNSFYALKDELRRKSISNQAHLFKQMDYYLTDNHFSHWNDKKPFIRNFQFIKCIVICLFFAVTTCYFYGGQDTRAGANYLLQDIKVYVNQLKEQSPAMKETIATCKKGYHYILSKSKEIQN